MFEGYLAKSPEDLLKQQTYLVIRIINPMTELANIFNNFVGVTSVEFMKGMKHFWGILQGRVKEWILFEGTLARSPESLLGQIYNDAFYSGFVPGYELITGHGFGGEFVSFIVGPPVDIPFTVNEDGPISMDMEGW